MADITQRPQKEPKESFHKKFMEKNSLLLTVAIILTISVGGLIEIAPLFYLNSTIEEVDGVRPYSPLELAGRQIYVREGCYNCHSQMIRPLRDEVERYGHYSLAAESMYDRPFQWGSKRTGPDLARVGGRYSDEWHRDHLIEPTSVVPESIMPPYAFLADAALDYSNIQAHLRVNQFLGVDYSDEAVENAVADLEAQVDEFSSGYGDLIARYPGAQVRNFDGNPDVITEMDALIAYLQVLGTMVDFSTYEPESDGNQR